MHWDIIAAASAPFILIFIVVLLNIWLEVRQGRASKGSEQPNELHGHHGRRV